MTERYLTSSQVRARYGGISDMTLWRWQRDEALGFPRPILIKRRRYWLVSDMVEWDARIADVVRAKPQPTEYSGAVAARFQMMPW